MTLIYVHDGCAVTKLSTTGPYETACGDFVCGDMMLKRVEQVECSYCQRHLEDLLGEPFFSETSESIMDFVLRTAAAIEPIIEPEPEPIKPEPEPEPELDDCSVRFGLLELD